MTGLNHWDNLETFTSRDVAYLIMGVDPAGPEKEKYNAGHIAERLDDAYDGAVKLAEHECIETGFGIFDIPVPAGCMTASESLWSVELLDMLDTAEANGDYESFSNWLRANQQGLVGRRFSRREIARWIRENGLKSVYSFDPDSSTSGVKGRREVKGDSRLSVRERTTLLSIIGVMLEMLKSPRAGRDSNNAVIDEMLANYDDRVGISKRTLEDKFAEAKRSLGAG